MQGKSHHFRVRKWRAKPNVSTLLPIQAAGFDALLGIKPPLPRYQLQSRDESRNVRN
jgi:hypothetical protein